VSWPFIILLSLYGFYTLWANRHPEENESPANPAPTSGMILLQTPLFILAFCLAWQYGALSRNLVSPLSIAMGFVLGHLIFAFSLLATHRVWSDAFSHFIRPKPIGWFLKENPDLILRFSSVAIAEEIIYRAATQPLLANLLASVPLAIVLTAVIFSLVHKHFLQNLLALVMKSLMFATMIGVYFYWTSSRVPVIILCALRNRGSACRKLLGKMEVRVRKPFFQNTPSSPLEFLIFALLLGTLYYWTNSLILVVIIHTLRNLESVYLEYLQKLDELGDETEALRAIEERYSWRPQKPASDGTTMSQEFLVELDHVRKTFVTRHFLHIDEETRKRRVYNKNQVHAADDICFGIRPGEIFGLLGPNGAGKTTTVKMVSGLVKPDRGTVFVDGQDVEKKRKKILRKVGVVLEGTRTSIWPLTPYENLLYYGNLKDVRGNILKQRAHELLDFIGLKEKKNVQVRRLSRGQKQKLAICIALIADPQVLLLDEPTTGLDVQSSRAIKDKIIELTRQQGRSVLVTTHDMHVAQELCDRIGIINKGKLIACKPTEELLELFSEQVFVFKVNIPPENQKIEGINGVQAVWTEQSTDGTLLVVRVATEPILRSEALYGIMNTLNSLGIQLLSIQQRQENLESVFLHLTSEPTPTEGKDQHV